MDNSRQRDVFGTKVIAPPRHCSGIYRTVVVSTAPLWHAGALLCRTVLACCRTTNQNTV